MLPAGFPVYVAMMRILLTVALAVAITACAALPSRDALNIDVAGIEPLPSEGLEMRLAITLRIQNPNDGAIEFSGAALDMSLNGRGLASGVSGASGLVPRYGETTLTIPVTISAFDVARQLMGFISNPNRATVIFGIDGKLDTGLLRARRFSDEVEFAFPTSDAL